MANEMIYSEATSLLSGDPIAVASIAGLFKKNSVEILEERAKLGFKERLEAATGRTVMFTTVGAGIAATSGYQELGLTGIVGSANTPLANGTYDFKIRVDSSAEQNKTITVTGAPITYTALLALINGVLTGAVASIVGGDIRITSSSAGAASRIFLIADTEDDLFNLLGASLETPVAGLAATSGYQEFGMTGVVAGNNTPLINGDYEFNISVDGTPSPISITVAAAPITYTALLALINAELSGALASIVGGDIRITSSSTGASSIIALTPKDYNDLFNKLSTTFDSAVTGIAATSGYQEFNLSGKAGTDVLPDATYTLTVAVDGDLTPTALSFVASSNTLADLMAAYNVTLAGTAVMAIVDGDIRITSASTGASSTIDITEGTTGGGETDLLAYYGRTSSTIDFAIDGINAFAGYQEFGMTGVAGGNNTPLANGDYEFRIDVDGGATQDITITVSGSPITYTALLALLNAELVGATASIVSGDIRISSNTTGVGSTIALAVKINTDIFTALSTTVDTAVDGVPEIAGYQELGLTGITGAGVTPLADADYEFKIDVDGGATQNISITVSSGPITYTALLALINTELVGAVASIVAGDIRITSSTTGTGSTIALASGEDNLLSALSFVYENPVNGLAAVNACSEISIDGIPIVPIEYCPLNFGRYILSINIDGAGAADFTITIPMRPGMEKLTWASVAELFNAIAGVSSNIGNGKLRIISDSNTSIVLAEGDVVTPTNYYNIVFKTSGGQIIWMFGNATERDNSYDNLITQYGFKVLTT